MHMPGPVRSVLLIAAIVATAGVLHLLMPQAVACAQAGAHAAADDFTTFLARVDAAQLELQNGRPAAFKALWSHADDVTLSGGFGGTIEKGWPAISSRLDWVGTRFSNGTNRIERLVTRVSGDLAYVIQAEHLRYRDG
jgi:hypothetical protein